MKLETLRIRRGGLLFGDDVDLDLQGLFPGGQDHAVDAWGCVHA